MSQENVEIAARWYEVAGSKKQLLAAMPRTMAFCHPEVEWSAPEDGTTYRGREGVRQRLEEWLESFDDYRYEVQRIIDCGGDEVLVEGTEVGRGATEWRRGSLDQLRAAHDPGRDDRADSRVLRRRLMPSKPPGCRSRRRRRRELPAQAESSELSTRARTWRPRTSCPGTRAGRRPSSGGPRRRPRARRRTP